MNDFRPLPLSFYDRATVQIALDLLGCRLVHETPEGLCAGRIVETEAYLGAGDPGSAASRGRTPRNDPMFGPPGTAFAYLTYGIYVMLNVVTSPEGTAGAVLLRALEPTHGLELMGRRRGRSEAKALCNGPGKLCQALGVALQLNRTALTRPPLYMAGPEGEPLRPDQITTTTRIGLRPGAGADMPLRFYVTGSPWVSRR